MLSILKFLQMIDYFPLSGGPGHGYGEGRGHYNRRGGGGTPNGGGGGGGPSGDHHRGGDRRSWAPQQGPQRWDFFCSFISLTLLFPDIVG